MLWDYAMELNRDASGARQTFDVTSDKKVRDQIGLAINVVYPVALLVRLEAGATNGLPLLDAEYVAVNQKIVAELAPTCTSRVAPDTPLHIYEVRYECVAANGETASDYQIYNEATGEWIVSRVDLDALKARAAANSSWLVAKTVLDAAPPDKEVIVHCEDSCGVEILSTIKEKVVSSDRLRANLTVLDGLLRKNPDRFFAVVEPNGTVDGLYLSAELIVAWTRSGEVYRLDRDGSATLLYDQKDWQAGPDHLK